MQFIMPVEKYALNEWNIQKEAHVSTMYSTEKHEPYSTNKESEYKRIQSNNWRFPNQMEGKNICLM